MNEYIIDKETLDRLINLLDEPSYEIPRGLSRDERREFIKNITKGENFEQD